MYAHAFPTSDSILRIFVYGPCWDRRATIVPVSLSSHNVLNDRAQELIKLPKDAESLLVSI